MLCHGVSKRGARRAERLQVDGRAALTPIRLAQLRADLASTLSGKNPFNSSVFKKNQKQRLQKYPYQLLRKLSTMKNYKTLLL